MEVLERVHAYAKPDAHQIFECVREDVADNTDLILRDLWFYKIETPNIYCHGQDTIVLHWNRKKFLHIGDTPICALRVTDKVTPSGFCEYIFSYDEIPHRSVIFAMLPKVSQRVLNNS